MTVALVEQAEAWATSYAAGTLGVPEYAATVRALGLDPAEALGRWDAVVAWQPWGFVATHEPAHVGHRVGKRWPA